MIWLKAFHVVAMVTWFAGLFYLPRLFVYHADTTDEPGLERFAVMERRLLVMMNIGATATVVLGLSMLVLWPGYLAFGWLHAKLALVALLIGYHLLCRHYVRAFALRRNRHSARWYRGFNELPTVLLVAIVILVVVRPF